MIVIVFECGNNLYTRIFLQVTNTNNQVIEEYENQF